MVTTIFRKLESVGQAWKRELTVYRLILRDPRTPLLAKVALGLAVGYALLPFDLIPDFLPIIGHVDDMLLVPALILLALKYIPPAVIEDCRRQERDRSTTKGQISPEA
jgi:uncharacterized membrane protein YkvA (DUF1232 family)